jgi:tRNA(fMet)-specific endonuclease VapC
VARRLILDTTALIAFERGDFDITALDSDDLTIAAISVAELRVGVELADTPQRAADRARVLTIVTATLNVLDYTERTAAEHARLIAHIRRTGTPRGAHDVIVAAHAAEHGRTIVSRDAKARFDDLPGILTLSVSGTG